MYWQQVASLLPLWGLECTSFADSNGQAVFLNATKIAADIKLWMAEADGEVACVEMLNATRVRLALEELHHEQRTYGARPRGCSMPSPLQAR